MNNLKVEVIKKLMMIDTKKELITIRECIVDAISRECDNDEKDQEAFAKWKEVEREKRGIND